MLSFKFVAHLSESTQAEAIFVLLPHNFGMDKVAKSFAKIVPNLAFQLEAHKFTGQEDSLVFLATKFLENTKKIFFIGVGKLDKQEFSASMDRYRNALGKIVDLIKKYQLTSGYLKLDYSWFSDKEAIFVADSLICLNLAAYKFDSFKSTSKSASWTCELECFVKQGTPGNTKAILSEVKAISGATNLARELSDLPPNIANPDFITSKASHVARKYNLDFKSFGEGKAKELGMGGFVAVGAGSAHEIKFFELKYNSPNPDAKTIVLIGKGITFDSGGISLKPADSMTDMKYDMSGAATVIGVAQAIAQLQANVNLICMAPLAENMPSGGSYRQDDIVTHMNGITTEIKNTDAEGRLILADAICYAEKMYKPSIIIDVATLTGACVVALGHFYTGMFTNEQKLADALKSIGDRVGDYVWQLPCTENYAKAIESSVADLANTGARNFGGGAISAAMFLKKFISQAKWVHLDIAGTEAGLPIQSYLGKTATGVGVRLLTSFIKEYF
jgi:leucyl aminopeptidase